MSNRKSKRSTKNDPCFCGSGRRFKHCCTVRVEELRRLENEKKDMLFVEGHEIMRPNIKALRDWLKKQPEFKDFNIIDVTKILTFFNYRLIQRTHYLKQFGPTIILAERTQLSDLAFEKRCQKDTTLMIMFRGAYIVFLPEEFPSIIPQLKKMIEIRMQDEKKVNPNDEKKVRSNDKDERSNDKDERSNDKDERSNDKDEKSNDE